ncbi:MAG: hypothetical protein H6816_08460 [Phycisphaerales bacterium]|nr:hypothetical protein [Phycisphaerales bacterium]
MALQMIQTSSRLRPLRYLLSLVLGGVAVAALTGCAEPRTEFDVVNVQGVGQRERFHQPFDECFYTIDRGGQVDMVARRVERGPNPGERVAQVIHVQTEFRAVPGSTPAESSMINATVHYAVLDGQGGVCYEGAGFFSTKEDPETGVMTGALERARLEENRAAGQGASVFNRVELTGTYRAIRNRRRVVRLLNELDRLFGPQPDYRPAPRADDPL